MDIKRDKNKKLLYVKCNILVIDNKKFYEVIKYYSEKFMEEQYSKALDFLAYANKFDCELTNVVLISHSEGVALAKGFMDKNNIVTPIPLIKVYSNSIKSSLRFAHSIGAIELTSHNGYFTFHCKSLTKEQEVFLLWLVYQIENFAAISCPNLSYNDKEANKIIIDEDILFQYKNLNNMFIVDTDFKLSSKDAMDFCYNNMKLSKENLLLKACLTFNISNTEVFSVFKKYLDLFYNQQHTIKVC